MKRTETINHTVCRGAPAVQEKETDYLDEWQHIPPSGYEEEAYNRWQDCRTDVERQWEYWRLRLVVRRSVPGDWTPPIFQKGGCPPSSCAWDPDDSASSNEDASVFLRSLLQQWCRIWAFSCNERVAHLRTMLPSLLPIVAGLWSRCSAWLNLNWTKGGGVWRWWYYYYAYICSRLYLCDSTACTLMIVF